MLTEHLSHIYSKRLAAGIGLVETMLALIIVSAGFLSLQRLQSIEMARITQTHAHYEAQQLLADVTQRVMANRAGFLDYNTQGMALKCSPTHLHCDSQFGQIAHSCTPKELAAFDLRSSLCTHKRLNKAELSGRYDESSKQLTLTLSWWMSERSKRQHASTVLNQ